MAAIIHQKDKKTGNIYVYESISHWDKNKKQSRAVRKCIGKIDPQTGEVIPTGTYNKKKLEKDANVKPGPVPITKCHRSFYGATYLFDKIGEITGVTADLKACFPNDFKANPFNSLFSNP